MSRLGVERHHFWPAQQHCRRRSTAAHRGLRRHLLGHNPDVGIADPTWLAWTQVLTSLLTAGTLLVYILELRVLRRQFLYSERQAQESSLLVQVQMRAARESSQGQNALNIVQYIERAEMLAARAAVDRLSGKPYERWSASDHDAADAVWRMWNVSALFEKSEVLPSGFLSNGYGGSILRHWRTLQPHIAELRRKWGEHRATEFEALAKKTLQDRPDLVHRQDV